MIKNLVLIFLCFSAVTIAQNKTYQDYDITYCYLDIEVTNTSTYVEGSNTMIFNVLNPVAKISFDLIKALKVDSVFLNNKKIDFSREDDLVHIPYNYEGAKSYSVKIYYHGFGTDESFSGIFNKNKGAFPITYTLSEPYMAKNWFPCKQDLLDKIDSTTIGITTDNGLIAVSNGLLKEKVILPENKVKFVWHTNYPMAYYLIAVTVGDFMEYSYQIEKPEFSLFFQNYIYNDEVYFKQEKLNIDTTVSIILAFNDMFGNYPFVNEKYGHVTAPIGGGMEHQTISTMVNFNYELVSHELAHQWFGDNITCAKWNDIWLNEGFATYSEYLVLDYYHNDELKYKWLNSNYKKAIEDNENSVYVPNDELSTVYRIFDGRLSYAKGGMVLHMLRNSIDNDQVFFDILKAYQTRYKDSIAVTNDFKELINEFTGDDYSKFFNQWIFGAGYPTYTINWNYENDTLFVKSTQSDQFFKTKLLLLTIHDNIKTQIKINQDKQVVDTAIFFPHEVTAILPDTSYTFLQDFSSINRIGQVVAENYYKIYPNPANNELSILTSYPGPLETNLALYNSSGQLVLEKNSEFADKQLTLLVDDIAPGMYYLSIENEFHVANVSVLIE